MAIAMTEPSTELTPLQAVSTQLQSEAFRREIQAALPEGVTVERFARITVTALMEDQAKQKDPAKWLVSADRASLFQAVLKCAQDGLLPDGRQAALVKRGNMVSYMPMVGGFRQIAGEHGWTITAHAVAANDDFDHTEEPPTITHKPVRPGVARGDFVACYAVARHRDGRRVQRVIYGDEVSKRRKMATTDQVWNQWEEQQWEKTAARDVFAELPLDPADKDRVARVLSASLTPTDAAALLYGQPLDTSPAQLPPAEPEDGSQQAPDATLNASEATGDTDAQGGDGDATDVVVTAAQDAAKMIPPQGVHAAAGRTLGDILALGDTGVAWFTKWIGDPSLDDRLQAALLAFTRVYLPDVYQQAIWDAQVEL